MRTEIHAARRIVEVINVIAKRLRRLCIGRLNTTACQEVPYAPLTKRCHTHRLLQSRSTGQMNAQRPSLVDGGRLDHRFHQPQRPGRGGRQRLGRRWVVLARLPALLYPRRERLVLGCPPAWQTPGRWCRRARTRRATPRVWPSSPAPDRARRSPALHPAES